MRQWIIRDTEGPLPVRGRLKSLVYHVYGQNGSTQLGGGVCATLWEFPEHSSDPVNFWTTHVLRFTMILIEGISEGWRSMKFLPLDYGMVLNYAFLITTAYFTVKVIFAYTILSRSSCWTWFAAVAFIILGLRDSLYLTKPDETSKFSCPVYIRLRFEIIDGVVWYARQGASLVRPGVRSL